MNVRLAKRGNQGQQSQQQFQTQPGERAEELALITEQDPVLFENPHGLDMDRETVKSRVSLFSRAEEGGQVGDRRTRGRLQWFPFSIPN